MRIQAEKVVLIEEQESEIDLVEVEPMNIEELLELEYDKDTVRNIPGKGSTYIRFNYK